MLSDPEIRNRLGTIQDGQSQTRKNEGVILVALLAIVDTLLLILPTSARSAGHKLQDVRDSLQRAIRDGAQPKLPAVIPGAATLRRERLG